MSPKPASLPDRISQALDAGTPIRMDLGNGSRLHIDRPMPFLCVHLARRSQPAARDVAMANAAYLVARNLAEAVAVLRPVGAYMQARFGAFLLLDIGELAQDQLAKDSPICRRSSWACPPRTMPWHRRRSPPLPARSRR